MSDPVLYEVEGFAARLTLARPERRNALSDDLVDALLSGLRRALADEHVRVVVLTAQGNTFCAGADLKAGGVARRSGEQPFVTLLRTLWDSPKPVIGCIPGSAYGGGVGLMAACDLVLAAEEASFAFSEVRIGVVPAMISVVVLPKIGIQHGMWLFLTGERFDARRAQEIGLVHRVLPRQELSRGLQELLEMLRLAGPKALQHAKWLVRNVPGMPMQEAFARTSTLIAELFASPEAQEGMRAFAEKRQPSWASE